MFFKLNSKITPFGGIYLIHKQLLSKKTIQFINNELGSRGYACSYNYSDIVLSRAPIRLFAEAMPQKMSTILHPVWSI